MWSLPGPRWNSGSGLVLKQWPVKATRSAVAHCASSFLFVAEWSWQQAQVGSGLQHTPCQSTHTVSAAGIYSLYIPIITVFPSLVTVHISSPWGAGQFCCGMGCPALSFPYIHHCSAILQVPLDTECLLFLTGDVWRPDQVRDNTQAAGCTESSCCKALTSELGYY